MTYNVPIPSLLAPNKITQYYNLYNNPIKNFTFFHYIQSIKQEKNNWGLYSLQSLDLIHCFYLKSCALLGAYYYAEGCFTLYHQVKVLDRNYWRNYYDSIIYKHHLKNVKDIDNKIILLNRLECAESDATLYKKKISRMFKQSFV